MLSDTQNQSDSRGVPIQWVGIRGLRYPVRVAGEATVGTFSLQADLAKDWRGTHMSRFVALVHENHQKLSPAFFLKMAGQLQKRLSCSQTRLELVFPFFLEKKAPVSGQSGILDYRATWRAEWIGAQKRWQQSVQVPIGTLCPCSKAISDRGAHNQRGIVTVSLQGQKPIPETKLVSLIEKCASSPLYSLLKRTDEKFVTEQAYDQPAFVEDVVRNVTLALRRLAVTAFRVETENFESIHNHNAYACVQEGAWLE